MLFDSNIIIQVAKESAPGVIAMMSQRGAATASVVRIEVYGFVGLTPEEKLALDEVFRHLHVHELTLEIAERAIALRQNRKIGLADAIIAATALTHNLTLITRNVDDFKHIVGMRIIDPFAPAT